MSDRIDVMISSTARDLPEHRKEAMEACLRQGMFPIRMEDLGANDEKAVGVSLKMVDDAEIYLGIFGWRYGYVPTTNNPAGISVTEMEYNRAVERGARGEDIERMIFIMTDDHPITGGDVEKGEGAAKLEKFKDRLKTDNIVNFFDSPDDLGKKIIDSLSKSKFRTATPVTTIHAQTDIPQPPESYEAHPYTLRTPDEIVGRQREINLLTDWLTKPGSAHYGDRIFSLVAIGGMGKSAVTWKWFQQDLPREKPDLAGRLWWSFYESDASFENFVSRALCYVGGMLREAVSALPAPEREERLINLLRTKPYLLVLDGLERILVAYANMDAARMKDGDLDDKTGNIGKSGDPKLRKTIDPRAGQFLRKLVAEGSQTRVLITTRLHPADLEHRTGAPLAGCAREDLKGLSDDDAVNLWRRQGVSGTRETLIRFFNRFGNYPLLITALAGDVAQDPAAPGDFDAWLKRNPNFMPDFEDLTDEDRKAHVLQYALQGLRAEETKVLSTLAAFRMPASYATLTALYVKREPKPKGEDEESFVSVIAIFPDEAALIDTLRALENRGLIGWDSRPGANRYDLHPIVRAVAWGRLDAAVKSDTYEAMRGHFEAMPTIDEDNVETLDDLTPAIELYNTLIGLGRFDDACDLFYARLQDATVYRLSASRQNIELLEALFPDGLDQLPRLSNLSAQAYTLNALSWAYDISGQPGRAALVMQLGNELAEQQGNEGNMSIGLGNLSSSLQPSGALREAESSARRALHLSRRDGNNFQAAISLYWLGLALAAHGESADGTRSLKIALQMRQEAGLKQGEGLVNAYLAQAALWANDLAAARDYADRAWELAHVQRAARDFIRAMRLQGVAALAVGDHTTADAKLHDALTRARAVNNVEEELPALTGLAELARQRGDLAAARELLDDVWDSAERGPYPLFHADALNVLAQIERDAGNTSAAITAATEAYKKAWCDGISADGSVCYAYAFGLNNAKAHLDAFGAPYPVLPPFDPANFDPMLTEPIDPS